MSVSSTRWHRALSPIGAASTGFHRSIPWPSRVLVELGHGTKHNCRSGIEANNHQLRRILLRGLGYYTDPGSCELRVFTSDGEGLVGADLWECCCGFHQTVAAQEADSKGIPYTHSMFAIFVPSELDTVSGWRSVGTSHTIRYHQRSYAKQVFGHFPPGLTFGNIASHDMPSFAGLTQLLFIWPRMYVS